MVFHLPAVIFLLGVEFCSDVSPIFPWEPYQDKATASRCAKGMSEVAPTGSLYFPHSVSLPFLMLMSSNHMVIPTSRQSTLIRIIVQGDLTQITSPRDTFSYQIGLVSDALVGAMRCQRKPWHNITDICRFGFRTTIRAPDHNWTFLSAPRQEFSATRVFWARELLPPDLEVLGSGFHVLLEPSFPRLWGKNPVWVLALRESFNNWVSLIWPPIDVPECLVKPPMRNLFSTLFCRTFVHSRKRISLANPPRDRSGLPAPQCSWRPPMGIIIKTSLWLPSRLNPYIWPVSCMT